MREVFLAPWLHSEEAPPHIDQLPGEEQGEPSQARKTSGTSAVYGVTLFRVSIVAVHSKVTVSEAEKHKRERSEAKRCDPEAVSEHVDHDFECENAPLERLRRTIHDVGSGCFEAETHVGHAGGDHDDLYFVSNQLDGHAVQCSLARLDVQRTSIYDEHSGS